MNPGVIAAELLAFFALFPGLAFALIVGLGVGGIVQLVCG